MRVMKVSLLLLSTMLSVMLSSYAYGEEPSTQTNSSFGLPFSLGSDGRCPVYPDGISLADSVRNCHTEVALISTTGVCTTRTLYRFIYEHPGGEEFEATLLERTAECPKAATVAVIGVDAEAVSLISPKHDLSPLPEDTESKARRLLDPPETDSQERHKEVGLDLSDASPKVFKVEDVTMLRFGLKDANLSSDGPAVILLNDKLFRLEGWCTTGHLFFSVYKKVFLCYTRFCCGCGEVIFYVYDLSGKAPQIVYENGKFSD